MADILIRKEDRAGRITLNRPQALNALTYAMCLEIDAALKGWRNDKDVALVIIDAAGDRAFCAGGDIAEMYATGMAGNYDYGRCFWADEYRLNARIAEYPQPVVSFLHGFTMGGGVGVGCHGSHRIVGETSQIAMPECGIGLVPDVGGSLLLARAPGHLGEYLGVTGARMGPADAILAGFADTFVPQSDWPDLLADLTKNGDTSAISGVATTPPAGTLAALCPAIDRHFDGETMGDILRSLRHNDDAFAAETLRNASRPAPLSTACTVEMIHRLRGSGTDMRSALDLEYRFTYRSAELGDFVEGIRAAIIDKDRNPRWRHESAEAVPGMEVAKMLMPLGQNALTFEEETA